MSGTRTPTRPQKQPAVVPAADRFRLRRATGRRRRWLRAVVVLLVVAAFAAAAWALGWSHLLGVDRIEVVGEHRATEGLVVLTADVDQGAPLARVDTGAVADRVRSLLVVEDASVQRVWPHTLRITVVERTPVAVAHEGDELRLVDRFGVGFDTVSEPPRTLPFLDIDLNSTSQAEVEVAVHVVDGLSVPMRRAVAAVEVHSPDDVRLWLHSGSVVLWGDDSLGEQKAAVLRALMKHPAQRYDVRAPMAPTTTD